MQKERYDAYI